MHLRDDLERAFAFAVVEDVVRQLQALPAEDGEAPAIGAEMTHQYTTTLSTAKDRALQILNAEQLRREFPDPIEQFLIGKIAHELPKIFVAIPEQLQYMLEDPSRRGICWRALKAVAFDLQGILTARSINSVQVQRKFKECIDETATLESLSVELNGFFGKEMVKYPLSKITFTVDIDLPPKILSKGVIIPRGPVLAYALRECIHNSVKMLNKGKVAGIGSISVYISRDRDKLCFDVIDSGAGVDLEEGEKSVVEKIMRPGYTTTETQGGTGLGLKTVQQSIMKIYGGTLTADNEKGREFVVSIRIPLTTQV